MSKRLASFNGPSTPNASPVKANPNSNKSPTPRRQQHSQKEQERDLETTFHRRLRTILLEIRSVALVWDDLILRDGLDAAKGLVDTRTEITNILKSYSDDDKSPDKPIVGPRLARLDRHTAELNTVLAKLNKCFKKLQSLVDAMETLHKDAINQKGVEWAAQPLWLTWSLRSFEARVPNIIHYHARSLARHTTLVKTLNNDSLPFDEAKAAIEEWAAQPDIKEGGWMARWEELCEVEVGRWEQ
ncbi:hypothetical protein DL93DRAFT_462189 [Clavulina sp. PMI_390]|nr:hypothetical protein DL93DRAFT_462189 [Clavulina sp. PMI_390]